LPDYQYRLKSFSERALKSIRQILDVNDSLHLFIKSSSQADLDKVVADIESFDKTWLIFKESLEPLIKLVAGIEEEEIKVRETENGYEI
jgi:predicted  nucleic acid-binding Zn-ribbon protein